MAVGLEERADDGENDDCEDGYDDAVNPIRYLAEYPHILYRTMSMRSSR
jgi:hypothetical protein